jgi:hypothetical protein
LAPDTLRERKIRSGTSGFAAVASRTTKAASSASAPAPKASVRGAPQPSTAAGSTIVYTSSISAPVISTAPSTSAPLPKPIPLSLASSRMASTAVMIPIGMFTKKIQCQLMSCVNTPPASRPTDAPAEATKP